MRKPVRLSALSLVLALAVGGCSLSAPTQGTEPAGTVADTGTAAAPDDPGADRTDLDAILAPFDLEGASGREIVDALDAYPQARPLAVNASVREDHVVVLDGDVEMTVPLPEDLFYVSVAPFVSSTHECFHHALGSCQGELPGQDVAVRITDGQGNVLVEDTVTTQANGFAGFWLPRGIEGGSIVMATSTGTGSLPLSTTPGSPTCLTDLQITAR